MTFRSPLPLLVLFASMSGCNPKDEKPRDTTPAVALLPSKASLANQVGPGGQRPLKNKEALIPPQCYTETSQTNNPCYVCHQDPNDRERHENRMRDGNLQGTYEFSDFAVENHWSNLFVDRTEKVKAISDDEIVAYVERDNWKELKERMAKNEKFEGYKPDLENLGVGSAAFDAEGFAKDGSGWVAFNYPPLPSTFWPTNGATDDVMVRLPENFRRAKEGAPESRDIYAANLAILEAAIKNTNRMSSLAIDERKVGVDLDKDGKLGRITKIARPSHYVGAASSVPVTPFLYPAGVEFLHTVRYLGIGKDGRTTIPPHMKEVRYMRKHAFIPAHFLVGTYDDEMQEKIEKSPPYFGDFRDKGIDNGFGWLVQGYLEDEKGSLRPNSYEEGLFCMGCHSTIGTTIDHTFAFGRKVEGSKGYGYVNLKTQKDTPNLGEVEGEIVTYLARAGGGSEFRANDEMREKYFKKDGTLDAMKVKAEKSLYDLLTPSKERALLLNKAYRVIVSEQSFLAGRDPTITPPKHVLRKVAEEVPPLFPEKRYSWDLRLAYSDDSRDVFLPDVRPRNAIPSPN